MCECVCVIYLAGPPTACQMERGLNGNNFIGVMFTIIIPIKSRQEDFKCHVFL